MFPYSRPPPTIPPYAFTHFLNHSFHAHSKVLPESAMTLSPVALEAMNSDILEQDGKVCCTACPEKEWASWDPKDRKKYFKHWTKEHGGSAQQAKVISMCICRHCGVEVQDIRASKARHLRKALKCQKIRASAAKSATGLAPTQDTSSFVPVSSTGQQSMSLSTRKPTRKPKVQSTKTRGPGVVSGQQTQTGGSFDRLPDSYSSLLDWQLPGTQGPPSAPRASTWPATQQGPSNMQFPISGLPSPLGMEQTLPNLGQTGAHGHMSSGIVLPLYGTQPPLAGCQYPLGMEQTLSNLEQMGAHGHMSSGLVPPLYGTQSPLAGCQYPLGTADEAPDNFHAIPNGGIGPPHSTSYGGLVENTNTTPGYQNQDTFPSFGMPREAFAQIVTNHTNEWPESLAPWNLQGTGRQESITTGSGWPTYSSLEGESHIPAVPPYFRLPMSTYTQCFQTETEGHDRAFSHEQPMPHQTNNQWQPEFASLAGPSHLAYAGSAGTASGNSSRASSVFSPPQAYSTSSRDTSPGSHPNGLPFPFSPYYLDGGNGLPLEASNLLESPYSSSGESLVQRSDNRRAYGRASSAPY